MNRDEIKGWIEHDHPVNDRIAYTRQRLSLHAQSVIA